MYITICLLYLFRIEKLVNEALLTAFGAQHHFLM
jgi:hypothetical protein